MQVKERKAGLARLETLDNGKPIQEAEWDMVSPAASSGLLCGKPPPHQGNAGVGSLTTP